MPGALLRQTGGSLDLKGSVERFKCSPEVWLTILLLFLILVAGGILTLIKSMQCAQAGVHMLMLFFFVLGGFSGFHGACWTASAYGAAKCYRPWRFKRRLRPFAGGFGDGSSSASAGDCQEGTRSWVHGAGGVDVGQG